MTAPEQPVTGAQHSLRVFFDQDAICAEVVCNAAPDADCRLSCDEGCEEWGAITRGDDGVWHYVDDDGTGHWQDKGHRMRVVDYCNVCEFINDDGAAEFGSGMFDIATLPITPQWEGDYYSWSPGSQPPAERAGGEAIAAVLALCDRYERIWLNPDEPPHVTTKQVRAALSTGTTADGGERHV